MIEKSLKIIKSSLTYIMIITIFIQYVYSKFTNLVNLFPDSSTYINYDKNIFLGQVDGFRTPLYPYFLKLIRFIFGENNFLNNVVYSQYFLFLISVVVLYFTLKKIIKSKLIICIATLAFSANPMIFLWNNTILTESLSVMFIVLLTFYTVSYLKKPTNLIAVLLGIHIFLMVMLRPIYIYLIPIFLIFYIIKFFADKENRKKHINAIISNISAIILIILYCFLIKINYGKFKISTVSNINNTVMIINAGIYEKGNNKEITDLINYTMSNGAENSFVPAYKLTEEMPIEEITNYTKTAKKNSIVPYSKYILKNAIDLGYSNIGIKYTQYKTGFNSIDKIERIENLINRIKIYDILIICGINIVFIISFMIKNKKIPYILSYFTVMILAGFFVIVIASPGEYVRLFLSNLPIIYIMIGYIIDNVIKEKFVK